MPDHGGVSVDGVVLDQLIRRVALSLIDRTDALVDDMVDRILSGDPVYTQPLAMTALALAPGYA